MALTVVSFILVMSVLVFVHEFGHLLVAKRSGIVVEEFGFGFPPRLVKVAERGGTVYSINAIPFGGFCRMKGEDLSDEPGSFSAASKLARAATLLAGPAMNLILAIGLFAVLASMTGIPDLKSPAVLVGATAPASPAALAGVQPGDRIVSIDGQAIATVSEIQAATARNLGLPIVFQIERQNPGATRQIIQVTMTPRQSPPPGEGALGLALTAGSKTPSLGEALAAGAGTTWQVVRMTFEIPATLLREGKPIGDAGFMGPIGIAVTTGEVVRSAIGISSWQPIILFMGLLSSALGITNLLPIPGLDGGRLLFVALEAIRRRKVLPAQEGMVHLIGYGLLLLLVGVLTVKEISALLAGTFPSVGLH